MRLSKFRRLCRMMAVLAAVMLSIASPLDAVAHAAKQDVAAGDVSVLARALSAFDQVDDALDHLAGTGNASPQLSLQAIWNFEHSPVIAPQVTAGRLPWLQPQEERIGRSLTQGILRPPRC